MSTVPKDHVETANPSPLNDYDRTAEGYAAENETSLLNAYYERPAMLELAPYRVRLQQSAAGLGPDAIMRLSIRKDDGFYSREWHLGCFNDDDPADAFDSVRWTGPSSVEIQVVDGRTFPVALEPISGRPRATASVNC
ncbi:hypothetical protein ACIHFD_45380 [Nonomuraea sp. NPDC051941]|uniref:hypothetical protein n=1 Tax=Nonomuraea sp. NPDC051941 TaxID=3364373 RepID=UPI0037C7F496